MKSFIVLSLLLSGSAFADSYLCQFKYMTRTDTASYRSEEINDIRISDASDVVLNFPDNRKIHVSFFDGSTLIGVSSKINVMNVSTYEKDEEINRYIGVSNGAFATISSPKGAAEINVLAGGGGRMVHIDCNKQD